jgi:hypothetical protein
MIGSIVINSPLAATLVVALAFATGSIAAQESGPMTAAIAEEPASGQSPGQAAPTIATGESAAKSGGGIDKEDKTGTNPLNFQRTAQVVNEFEGLGHAQINLTRFRFAQPFDGGKMSFRVEIPLVYAHAAIANSGGDEGGGGSVTPAGGASRFGLGDINLKFSYVPYATKKGGLLTAVELNPPTATESVLGTGKWVLAPSVAYGFFLPGNHIFAPAYKHSISFAGRDSRSDVNNGSFDFYFVSKFDHNRQWITVDPTYLLNYQQGKYSGATLRVIYGRVLGKIGDAVVSGYVKPGVGIGHDRPNDWSLEAGISLIGF